MLILHFSQRDVALNSNSMEVKQQFGVQLVLPIQNFLVRDFFDLGQIRAGLACLRVCLCPRSLRCVFSLTDLLPCKALNLDD